MTFEGEAGFENASFEGVVGFIGATFEGQAEFLGATFERGALFDSATFEGSAEFSRAAFEGSTMFSGATFKGSTNWLSATFGVKRPGQADHGYGASTLAWLANALFDKLSDIGSYLGVIDIRQLAGATATKLQGLDGIDCSPFLAALHLAVKKGLLILGWEASEKFTQEYACLYGIPDKLRAVQADGKLTGELVPNIPNSIAFWQTGQTIVSAVLIFLFLLALRNHFRIK